MSLITELMGMLNAIESDKIAVHEERCISIRNKNADCLLCAQVCTSGAIAYQNNELNVDPHLCIGCGTCATACPTSAIEIKSPSDDELTKSIKQALVASKGYPVIACEQALGSLEAGSYDERQVCLVPCLGRIDESVLVGLAAYKAKEATLLCNGCEACEHAPGGDMIREVLPSAQSMLEAFASPLILNITEDLPEHIRTDAKEALPASGVSRRDFFKSAKESSSRIAKNAAQQKADEILGGGVEQIPAAYQKVNREGTLSQFVPTRRIRVYNYLNHIGEPVGKSVKTRIIGSLDIDKERCSSCRMCAVFCPTGAIKKIDTEDTYGIVHRPSACMQCRLCERICPEEAITIGTEVPLDQFLGKKALCYAMKKPSWTPNRPSSLYDKVHSVIGDDLEMCMF